MKKQNGIQRTEQLNPVQAQQYLSSHNCLLLLLIVACETVLVQVGTFNLFSGLIFQPINGRYMRAVQVAL